MNDTLVYTTASRPRFIYLRIRFSSVIIRGSLTFPASGLLFLSCESFSGLELHGNGTDEFGFECTEVKSHGFSSTDSFDSAFDWRGPVMAL